MDRQEHLGTPDLDVRGRASGAAPTIRAKFRPSRALLASLTPEAKAKAPRRRRSNPQRLARLLALAYHIERLIEAGEVTSYGAVARALGLTQPRITQIAGLLMLSPAIQDSVLLGTGEIGIREAMRAAREAEWEVQSAGGHLLATSASTTS